MAGKTTFEALLTDAVREVMKTFDNSADVESALRVVLTGVYTCGVRDGAFKAASHYEKEAEKETKAA